MTNKRTYSSIGEAGPTPRQAEALAAVEAFHREMGCSPSLQDLAERLGIKRPSAFQLVGYLKGKGLLGQVTGKYRNLVLTGQGHAALREHARTLEVA